MRQALGARVRGHGNQKIGSSSKGQEHRVKGQVARGKEEGRMGEGER